MKKSKIIFTVILILLVSYLNDTKALYNGSGGTLYPGDGKTYSCSNDNPYCSGGPLNNYNSYAVIKVGLYYIDQGKFEEQIGSDYYFTAKDFKIDFVDKKSIIRIEELNECSGDNRYSCASKKLKEYFGDTKGNPKTKGAKDFLEKVTGKKDYSDVLTKESQFANKKNAATKGYRIIIEPVRSYVSPIRVKNKIASLAPNEVVVLTPKELANIATKYGKIDKTVNRYVFNGKYIPSCTGDPKKKPEGCTNSLVGIGSAAQYLFTEFKDVGIDKQSQQKCEGVTVKTLADYTNGCGYNIIDISQYVNEPKCYVANINTKGSLTCSNTNQNNTSNFEEEYKQITCTKEDAETNKNSKYGKKISETKSCILYCKESAYASFPGNIVKSVDLKDGTSSDAYFAWPGTKKSGATNLLKMSSKFECTLVNKDSKKCSNDDKEKLKKDLENKINELNFGVSVEGGTNAKVDKKLEIDTNETKSSISKIKNGKEIEATKEVYLIMPYGTNQLYNKQTDKVSDCGIGTCKTEGVLFDRKQGVISFNAIKDQENKKYNLKIKKVSLGSDNKFGKLITNYKCQYSFNKSDDSPSCECPPDTNNAGKDLSKYITPSMTCAELKQTHCDEDIPNTCDGYSPESWNNYKTCYLEALKVCNEKDKTTSDFRKLDFSKNILGIRSIDIEIQNLEKEKSNEDSLCAYNKCKSNLIVEKIDMKDCINEKIRLFNLTESEASDVCKGEKCQNCVASNGVKYDLTSCMSTGNSYKICEYLYCPKDYCPNGICDEKCSTDCVWSFSKKQGISVTYKKICGSKEDCGSIELTCPGGKTGMKDPTSCMEKQLSYKLENISIDEGLSRQIITVSEVRQAFNSCKEEVCPSSTAPKVVFRTIDLNNPFPGKYNKVKFKDYGYDGRKPGENWDSKTAIEVKILNARGNKGYDLYNKDPLYIIVLKPDTIKKIREYNQDHSYDDFNLNCTNNEKTAACISDFLHKQGTIDNLNPSDFIKNKYENKNSVSNCYNMSYDELSFNNCYNKDN